MVDADGTGMSSLKIYPRDILFIIFSKLHVLIGVFVIVVALVVAKVMIAEPVYQVHAAVLIKPLVDSRLLLHANRFMVDPVMAEDLNSEIKLMSSRELMTRVVKELGTLEKMKKKAGDKPKEKGVLVRWGIEYEASDVDKANSYIRSGLDISPVTVSHMIQISKTGGNPKEITKIVKTFLECYIDFHIEARKMVGAITSYKKQILSYEGKIHEIEEELRIFEKKWFIIDSAEQYSFNIKQIQLLHDSLTQARANVASQQAKVNSLQEYLKKGVIPMIEEYRTIGAFTELNKVYLPLLVEKKRIELLYKKSSGEYQDAGRQTEQIEKENRKEQKRLLAGMRVDLKAMIKREEVLESAIDRAKKGLELLKEKEIEQSRLARRLKRYRNSYDLYMNKLEEAQVAEDLESARVANVFVSSWPTEPSVPVSPNKKALLLLAIPAGMIAGIGAAFAAFFLDHTVKRSEDLEQCSGVPVFSSLGIIRR
ncbi:MAG: hypothetical protein D3925_01075 [Candidatus Electrothrix sp. AR5]|nr:hypothetical protein [Candidatus Electrothrix sp. AR5]